MKNHWLMKRAAKGPVDIVFALRASISSPQIMIIDVAVTDQQPPIPQTIEIASSDTDLLAYLAVVAQLFSQKLTKPNLDAEIRVFGPNDTLLEVWYIPDIDINNYGYFSENGVLHGTLCFTSSLIHTVRSKYFTIC